MAQHLLLIAGDVGTGKTTVARALTANLRGAQKDSPIPYITYANERDAEPVRAVRLGRGHRTSRSGMDTINAADYEKLHSPKGGVIAKLPGQVVIADGNQLLHETAIGALQSAGVKVTVVRLTAADRGRRIRARGSYAPSASAQKRTSSTIDNYAAKHKVLTIDTTGRKPEQVAATIAGKLGLTAALRL